jgi:hypothetical protein
LSGISRLALKTKQATNSESKMTKKLRDVLPLDIETVEFTPAPYDGRMAVEQRLRNLVEIALDIQARHGLLGTHKKTSANGELS